MLLSSLTTLGFRLEATPYTVESLSASNNDFNLRVFNINVGPEFEEYKREYAVGNFSKFASVIGKRKGTVSFSVDVSQGSSVSANPTWSKCLLACGLTSAANGTAGISWTTDARYSNVPATIEVCEQDEGTAGGQLVYKLKGCMGNAQFMVDSVGVPVRIDFEFQGGLHSISDRAFANIQVPSGLDTSKPEAVLGVSAYAYNEQVDFGKVSINLGNDVQLEENPSFDNPCGYRGAHIVNRSPTISFDPLMSLLSNRATYTRLIAGTEGSFLMTAGASNQFTFSAPKFQVIKAYGTGDRAGGRVNAIDGILNRNAGNDEFKIAQGVA